MKAATAPLFLIVDDEPDTCWVLQQILRKLGPCEIALNARDALSRAARHTFSLVLLDAKLPDVDGLDLALEFRAADPDVPILLVSGYFCRDDAAVLEARASGLVQAFVGKPFLHEDILRTVRDILDLQSSWKDMRVAQGGAAIDRVPWLSNDK
jgi:DNA-binding NtrC family response regulator